MVQIELRTIQYISVQKWNIIILIKKWQPI